MKKYKKISLLLSLALLVNLFPVRGGSAAYAADAEPSGEASQESVLTSTGPVTASPAPEESILSSSGPVIASSVPGVAENPSTEPFGGSGSPSPNPSAEPQNTNMPSSEPSVAPIGSALPSSGPSVVPTGSALPSSGSSVVPTGSALPSSGPSVIPTGSALPSMIPTGSAIPTAEPMTTPSLPADSAEPGPAASDTPASPPAAADATTGALSVYMVKASDKTGKALSTIFVPKGGKVSVRVASAEGADAAAMQYQWYQDGTEIAGQTASDYTITAGKLGRHTYTCEVVSGTKKGTASVTAVGYKKSICITLGQKQKLAAVFGGTGVVKQRDIKALKVKTKKAKKSFKIIKGNILQPVKYYTKSKVTFTAEGQKVTVTVKTALPKVTMRLKLSGDKKTLRGIPRAYGASKIEFQYRIRNSKRWGNNVMVSGKFRKPNKMGIFKNPTPILIKKYRVRAVYKTEKGKNAYTKWTIIKL